jgi:hypothetical protein
MEIMFANIGMENPHVVPFFLMSSGFVYYSVCDLAILLFFRVI